MWIQSLIVTTAVACTTSSPQLWFPKEGVEQLIYRADKDGCAYVKNWEVVFLNSTGGLERKYQLPKGKYPLYVAENGSMQFGTYPIVEGEKPTASPDHSSAKNADLFAQEDNIFLRTWDVTYLGNPTASFKSFDRNSAIGVNPSRNLIAYVRASWTAPRLDYAVKRKTEWTYHEAPIDPFVEDVGYCRVLFNDLIFLNDNTFVYVGIMFGVKDEAELQKAVSRSVDMSRFEINDTGSVGDCYLFACRLEEGRTRIVGHMKYRLLPEGRGPVFGKLTCDKSRKNLYVNTNKGIVRLDTDDLLKRANL